MSQSENPVRHLLWCILSALRSAEGLRSETARRRFIAEWLGSARQSHSFRGMAAEFTTIRQLLESDKKVSIEATLSTLLENSTHVEDCDLFRFRSALSRLRGLGWISGNCFHPEEVVHDTLSRAKQKRRHILQVVSTDVCFAQTGQMIYPVAFNLIQPLTDCPGQAELAFHEAHFQVLHGAQTELPQKKQSQTIYVGLDSLPDDVWSPSPERLWEPDVIHSDLPKRMSHGRTRQAG